jgi:hypothetical protein
MAAVSQPGAPDLEGEERALLWLRLRLQRVICQLFYIEAITMTKISLEFDSDHLQKEIAKGAKLFANKKIGILSSIALPDKLVAAFDAGYTTKHHKRKGNSTYTAATIQNNETDLINDGCEFIAAVGGSIVLAAIFSTSQVYFVSLVGAMPKDIGTHCQGGVSLESWASNKDRIDLVKSKLSLANADNIALYRNANSAMASDEAAAWTEQVRPSAAQIYNSSGNYNTDFNGAGAIIPAGVQGIVVSSDPTFQNNKNDLVTAINTWVGAQANRYVVYPLQIYREVATGPATTKSTLYGPDLYQAYYKLGQLARDASNSDEHAYIGFEVARNLTLHL